MTATEEVKSFTMTIEEAAKAFGISRGLAYSLARRDALPVPTLKIGRRLLVSRIAVDAVLSRLKEDGGQTAA